MGIGDSTTVAHLGVKEELKKRGTKVFDGFNRKTAYPSEQARRKLLKESTVARVTLMVQC